MRRYLPQISDIKTRKVARKNSHQILMKKMGGPNVNMEEWEKKRAQQVREIIERMGGYETVLQDSTTGGEEKLTETQLEIMRLLRDSEDSKEDIKPEALIPSLKVGDKRPRTEAEQDVGVKKVKIEPHEEG